MSRPRIVFCYRYGLLGGVSAQLLNRYPYLSQEYDVSIVYESDYGMASRFPSGVARLAPTVEEMRDVLRELNPDVVVIIDSPKFFQAWRAAGSVGRLVLEVHTTTANITYLHERDQLEGVAHIVTVSSYMEKLLSSYGLTDLAPVTVVPNCLDERWTKPSPEVRLDGVPALWVGKLDGHKRWRTAVDIMEELARVRDNLLPIIVGGQTANATEVQGLTTRLATSPGLARATWLPKVEYDRMPALYTSVGLSGGMHISTTTNESFGMAVAESLVRGCPVVAPAVGALPELLPPAALYPSGDWVAARERAARAITDPAFREELLSTADFVRDLTRPERVLEAYRSVISAVLGGHSADGAAPAAGPSPSIAPVTVPKPSQPVERAPEPSAAPQPAPEPEAAATPAPTDAATPAPTDAATPASADTPTSGTDAASGPTGQVETPAAPDSAPASTPGTEERPAGRRGLVGAPATGPVAVVGGGVTPRSPVAVVGLAEHDLTPQPLWLDAVLVPGEVYRLRALTVGRDDTKDDAALVRFEVKDGAPDGGRGLTLSKTIGPYTYLVTGPGQRITDVIFTVVKPMHRVGVMTWDNRGPVRVRTLVIEKVQSPQRPVDFFLSFDVEALPARAPSDWVQRLVWGKLDTGSYGIGRICDVVEQHGLRANFMIDYSSCERDGDAGVRAIVDFLRERGHEVHLHLHSEWLARWWGLETEAPVYLDNSSYDMARRMLDYIMRRHEEFTGERPRVFRAGGYRVNPEFVLAAGSLGLEALTNIRDDMLTNPLDTARTDAREPFVWENGVVEIPVDLSPEPLSDSFEKYLGRFDVVVPRKQQERTFNLVMHSWSLMRRNERGHHDAFEPVHEERLHQICEHIVEHGRARLYGEYLDQRHLPWPTVRVSSITIAKPEPRLVPESVRLVRCNVCDAAFNYEVMVASACPGCGCLARHRQLQRVVDSHGNVFDRRRVLAYESLAPKRLRCLDGATTVVRLDGALLPAVDRTADGSFDAVLALDALNQVADVSSLVSGIARVLTTGGVFVTTVPATSPDRADGATAGAGEGSTDYRSLLSAHFTVSSWPSIDPVTDETTYVLFAYKL